MYDHHLLPLRADYSDAADFGSGFIARNTWTGRLDAPDFMPQGSMMARFGKMRSYASRDRLADCADIGVHHCGPESLANA